MDSKDFKKYISEKIKEENSKNQSSYAAKQRQSRPRAKTNVLNPKLVGI